MEEEEQEMTYTLSDHRHIQKMSPISILDGWIEENQKFFQILREVLLFKTFRARGTGRSGHIYVDSKCHIKKTSIMNYPSPKRFVKSFICLKGDLIIMSPNFNGFWL